MRLSTVIGCLLYIIVLSILDVRCGIADGASPSQPAVIGFINISSQNKGINAVIDLLSTNLSKNPMIQLVEREQLDIVLKELELTSAGFENRKTLLKLGQLIRADGLGLFSLSEDGKILRVRLVDTKYGLRLLDTLIEWKEGEISHIVEEIIPRITSVASKLLIPPEKEVLIGILGMRNIEPNSYLNWLELSLPGLISSRLSQEPRIIIMEREDLDLVVKEDVLTKGGGGKFLGSMALIEGEIKQISTEEKKNRFVLTLHIKQADGKSIGDFKTEGDTEKLPLLTEDVSNWAVKTVTNSPPQGIWDIKSESARFLKEGELLLAHGGPDVARPFLETSYALDPENEVIIRPLLEVWRYAGKPGSLEQAQFVYRQIDLLATQSQRGTMDRKIVLLWLDFPLIYLDSEDSVKTKEIKDFNRRTRRYYEDFAERVFLSLFKVEDFKFFCTAWPAPTLPLVWAAAVSETPEEAMQRVRKGISKLLLGPDKGGYPIPERCRLYFLYRSMFLRVGHLDKKEMLNLWLDFLEELSKSDDPIVKISAELGFSSIFHEMFLRGKDNWSQLFYDHADKVMKILIEELNYPNEPFPLEDKLILRWLVLSETMQIKQDYSSYPEIWIQKVGTLLKPLIDKGDVENLLLWTPSFLFSGVEDIKIDSGTAKQILNLLDSIINALENTDKYLDDRVVMATLNIVRNVGSEQLSPLISIRKKFLEIHPDVKSESILSSGLKISILYDINKYITDVEIKNQLRIVENQITRDGKMMWVLLKGMKDVGPSAGGWVGLIGIDLEDKSLNAFWSTSLPPLNTVLTGPLQVTRPVVSPEVICSGVWGLGIIKFPGTAHLGIGQLENLEIITDKDGLPSNYISDIARVDNKLFVSLGGSISKEGLESGLGIYDIREREWKTISSSRSKDKICPLNVERPYKITSLTPTSDGKKLFFLCEQSNQHIREGGAQDNLMRPLNGFWKMDIESGKMEHVWKYFYNRCNIILGKENWWIHTDNMLISFDPDLETGEVIIFNIIPAFHEHWIESNMKDWAACREAPSMKKIRYISRRQVQFKGEQSGLFGDVFWALTETGPCCIFLDQPLPKVKKFNADILGEDRITGLYPTPYGVVVIGKNKIGLIEENPEP